MCITTHPLGIHTQLDAKKIEERESMFCKHGPFLPVYSPICTYYLLNMDDAFCMNFLCLYRRTSLVKKYITFVLDIHVLLLSNRDVNRMLTNVLFLLDTLWIKSCHNLPNNSYLKLMIYITFLFIIVHLKYVITKTGESPLILSNSPLYFMLNNLVDSL